MDVKTDSIKEEVDDDEASPVPFEVVVVGLEPSVTAGSNCVVAESELKLLLGAEDDDPVAEHVEDEIIF